MNYFSMTIISTLDTESPPNTKKLHVLHGVVRKGSEQFHYPQKRLYRCAKCVLIELGRIKRFIGDEEEVVDSVRILRVQWHWKWIDKKLRWMIQVRECAKRTVANMIKIVSMVATLGSPPIEF